MADAGVDCIEPLDPLGGVEVRDVEALVAQGHAQCGDGERCKQLGRSGT